MGLKKKKKKQEKRVYSLTPKGVILWGLGGYTPSMMKEAETVCAGLVDYMERVNKGIVVIDGELRFVDVKKEK